ncbi:MAG: hypothetical protein MZU84_04020 [Sphingobacterium sp.]|nr:hypothetical protein [Sphingobacterium sp.]
MAGSFAARSGPRRSSWAPRPGRRMRPSPAWLPSRSIPVMALRVAASITVALVGPRSGGAAVARAGIQRRPGDGAGARAAGKEAGVGGRAAAGSIRRCTASPARTSSPTPTATSTRRCSRR